MAMSRDGDRVGAIHKRQKCGTHAATVYIEAEMNFSDLKLTLSHHTTHYLVPAHRLTKRIPKHAQINKCYLSCVTCEGSRRR